MLSTEWTAISGDSAATTKLAGRSHHLSAHLGSQSLQIMTTEPKTDKSQTAPKVFEYPESERLRDAEVAVSPRDERHPLISVLLRAIVAVIVFFLLVALMLISAIPYGGGSGFLIGLVWLSLICLPVWVLLPLKRLFSRAN